MLKAGGVLVVEFAVKPVLAGQENPFEPVRMVHIGV